VPLTVLVLVTKNIKYVRVVVPDIDFTIEKQGISCHHGSEIDIATLQQDPHTVVRLHGEGLHKSL